jgi:Antibiotic biosynthesis monooxygenase
MDRVHFSGRFPKIDPENLAEFKKLAKHLTEIAKGEPGNLAYDFFFNADETVCVVRETYADSAAVLSHMALMTDLPRLVGLGGGFEFECHGNPTPALVEAAQMSGFVYHHFTGK